MTGFNIAPLLIQPIIENAFKHISHFKEASSNSIYINIEEKDNHLYVAVSNTFDKNNSVAHLINNGGLGIKNLQRRLELLYPNRFMFETTEAAHIFNTMLKIKFVEQKHLTLYS